jgi:LacI family transcriptional regulator
LSSLKHVADIAGVSTSTVSHILSGRGSRYSEKTQQIVRLATEKANYQPNLLAAGLRRGKTNTIGMLIPQFYNEAFGLERDCMEKGYMLQVGVHYSDPDMGRRSLNTFSRSNVDGVLIFSPYPCMDLPKAITDKPVVIIDHIPHPGFISLIQDFENAINCAVNYLAGLGHSQIGYVGALSDGTTCGYRETCFRNSMQSAGFDVDSRHLADVKGDRNLNSWDIGDKSARDIIPKWQKNGSMPTALIVTSSEVAVGFVSALIENGIRVPEDISIIGLMDQSIGRYGAVPITGIDTKYHEIASDGINLLIKLLSNEKVIKDEVKKYIPELIKRKSCASPRK